MMIKYFYTILPLCWMLTATKAMGEIYRCKDSSGHLITSDRPIPECAEKSIQVFKDNGVLKDQVSITQTSEQRRNAELLDQQRIKDERIKEQNKKELKYLLAHYPNEKDIDITRKNAIDLIEAKISAEKLILASSTIALTKNHTDQAHIPKNQPGQLALSKVAEEDINETIRQSQQFIQRYQTEENNLNREYDEIHKRYNEFVLTVKN